MSAEGERVNSTSSKSVEGNAVGRLAIIGAGAIAEVHVQALKGIPDAVLTWIADQDLARAQALAHSAGAAATSSNEEVISASDVDAVLVATPTPFHRAIVELAAAHGKDVLCEKPMARTAEDAWAMMKAGETAGTRLMIGHVVRFFPEYARMKAALNEGVLGQIGVVRASQVGPSPSSSRAWMAEPIISGGVVLDMNAFNEKLRLAEDCGRSCSFLPWGADANAGFLRVFVEAVRNNVETAVTGEDGLRALEAALCAYASACRNERVSCPSDLNA